MDVARARSHTGENETRLAGRVAGAVRTMPPGAFAFVMATGIVAAALSLVGQDVVAMVLLGVAIAALFTLLAALVVRVVRHWDLVIIDVRDPNRAFGFVTIVAAINVVGALMFSFAPLVTVALLWISFPIWLLLTYGIPAGMMLGKQDGPPALKANGSWFIWVVGTQSLSVVTGIIDHGLQVNILGVVAVGLWSIGVALYLMLTTLITLRLLTTRNDAASIRPSYWVYMGATAISVYSGWSILSLLPDLPIMVATHDFISGFTFLLWAFGVFWIPMLVIFGIWRHVIQRYPVRYETELWSMVFPLGMFSVASIHLGELTGLPVVHDMGVIGTWIAAAAWLTVATMMTVTALGKSSRLSR